MIRLLLLLALAGCAHEPPPLRAPPADAPTWNLNGDWNDDSNALITPPPGAHS